MIINEKIYFSSYFECTKNRINGCLFTFTTKERQEKHIESCFTSKEIKENPKVNQIEYGNILSNEDYLINNYNLTRNELKNNNFIFYDIESILKPINENRKSMLVENAHFIVSIGAISFINNIFTEKFWCVKDSSEESIKKIVRSFLEFCIEEQGKMNLSLKIPSIEIELENKIKFLKPYFFSPDTKETAELRRVLYFIKKYQKLNCYAYNASGYDLKLLLKYFADDHFSMKAKDFNILKRNQNYISVEIHNLIFKDLMLFSSPMSLDKYLKTWSKDKNVKKLVFPYTLFSSIEGG